MLRKLYSEIDRILVGIDFGLIWRGFSMCDFALYNQSTVYFKDKTIKWDERFLGNTAIDYDNQIIAIWSVESPETEDPELLAAGIVHEMFHVYQKNQGETRYPNDLELLTYPDDLDNYHCKMVETRLLAKAFLEKDPKVLKEFIALRKVRLRLINEVIYQEYYAETLEGMAEYAGLAALEQINGCKSNARLTKYLSLLSNPGDLLYNPRRLAYFTGTILCFTLRKLEIDFYHELSERRTIFEIVADRVGHLAIGFEEFVEKKQNNFDRFLQEHLKVVPCDSVICGYDPMNMTRLGNKILCDHFVILDDEFIRGPIMLLLREGSLNRVEGYIK